MNNQDVTSKYQSLIITAIIGVLCMLLLLLNLNFKQNTKNKPLVIEFAMAQETNFGNTDLGKGEEEPQPSANEDIPKTIESKPSFKKTEEKTPTQSRVIPIKTKTQESPKKIPSVSNKKATTKSKAQESSKKNNISKTQNSKPNNGNSEANAVLKNILGGKGKANSKGQGNSDNFGNLGDPKGNSNSGKEIGENWKTIVPENQSHNCNSSGVVIVDIVVNANGTIKRATPRVTNSQCLANRAKELVLKYVTAFPGADGRRGSYKVSLK